MYVCCMERWIVVYKYSSSKDLNFPSTFHNFPIVRDFGKNKPPYLATMLFPCLVALACHNSKWEKNTKKTQKNKK